MTLQQELEAKEQELYRLKNTRSMALQIEGKECAAYYDRDINVLRMEIAVIEGKIERGES